MKLWRVKIETEEYWQGPQLDVLVSATDEAEAVKLVLAEEYDTVHVGPWVLSTEKDAVVEVAPEPARVHMWWEVTW